MEAVDERLHLICQCLHFVERKPYVWVRDGKRPPTGRSFIPIPLYNAVEAINALMLEAIEKNIFKSFKVGSMDISHQQFADDAIFFWDWSTHNAVKLLHLLKNFKAASVLTINLRKSWLIGVEVQFSEVEKLANKLHCLAENIPFLVSGLTYWSKYEKAR